MSLTDFINAAKERHGEHTQVFLVVAHHDYQPDERPEVFSGLNLTADAWKMLGADAALRFALSHLQGPPEGSDEFRRELRAAAERHADALRILEPGDGPQADHDHDQTEGRAMADRTETARLLIDHFQREAPQHLPEGWEFFAGHKTDAAGFTGEVAVRVDTWFPAEGQDWGDAPKDVATYGVVVAAERVAELAADLERASDFAEGLVLGVVAGARPIGTTS